MSIYLLNRRKQSKIKDNRGSDRLKRKDIMEKRYNTLNEWLKEKFGEKVYKISIDAGFTCPNRDGKISNGGCVFCSERGSGDFAASGNNLLEQFNKGKELMEKKWKHGKYIAYLQAFTNTYAPVEKLREIYTQLISIPDVVALAIATRPDCLSDEVIKLLTELSKSTFLWVELGLQTANDSIGEKINRGYETRIYTEAMKKLNAVGIPVVTHIIFGLPDENKEMMLETVDFVANSGSWGVKLHMLHVLKDTKLETMYRNQEFQVFEMEDYVKLLVDSLERLPKDMVIHRVTGDGGRDSLVAPLWSLKKFEVLNAIDEEFVERSSSQGCLFKKKVDN